MTAVSKQSSESPIASGTKELGQHGLKRVWSEWDSLQHLSSSGMLLHHLQRAVGGLLTAGLTSVVSIVTIGLSLFVLSALLFVMENIASVADGVESNLSMHLYLQEGVTSAESGLLMNEISEIDGVASVSFVSKQDALGELQSSLGEEAVLLEGLDSENPLPASIEVVFEDSTNAERVYSEIEKRFVDHSAFEYIQYSRSVIEDVARNLKKVRRGALLALCVILLMTAFIISNTIQLALYSRRQEIEIMRLVGATDGFIRMPFLIEGFIQGLSGAGCALCILYFVRTGVDEFAAKVEFLKYVQFETHFLSLWSIGLVLMVGVLVGVAGSYYAVRRFVVR